MILKNIFQSKLAVLNGLKGFSWSMRFKNKNQGKTKLAFQVALFVKNLFKYNDIRELF